MPIPHRLEPCWRRLGWTGLLALVMSGCGGGGGRAPSSSDLTPADAGARRIERTSSAGAEAPPAYTGVQLAGCATTPTYFSEIGISDLPSEAPCLIGQYEGQTVVRNGMQESPTDPSRHTGQACRVMVLSDNTARVQFGDRQLTLQLTPSETALRADLTYGNLPFQKRKVSGHRVTLSAFAMYPAEVGVRVEELTLTAKHHDDAPGWQLETWVNHPDLVVDDNGLDRTMGCLQVLPEADSPALTTSLSDAQLKTCPAALNPVTLDHLPCFTGTVAGITVHNDTLQPLTPPQSCLVWIRPDGVILTQIGQTLNVQRLETRTWYGLNEQHGSAWFPVWLDDTYQVQRLSSYMAYERAGASYRDSFILDVYRQVGDSGLPTLSVRSPSTSELRCMAKPAR